MYCLRGCLVISRETLSAVRVIYRPNHDSARARQLVNLKLDIGILQSCIRLAGYLLTNRKEYCADYAVEGLLNIRGRVAAGSGISPGEADSSTPVEVACRPWVVGVAGRNIP